MAQYMQYTIRNLEPLRIADDSRSRSGQIATLCYIPGTTIRGLIIGKLANYKGENFNFSEKKEELFSGRTKFLNAFLSNGDRLYIPSPKGFYENKLEEKGKKEIQNVTIDGELEGAVKRAALGQYARIEDGCIYYRSVKIGSDLKINMGTKSKHGEKTSMNETPAVDSGGGNTNLEEKGTDLDDRNVFRNEYILPGYEFTGWIAVEDTTLLDPIRKAFSGQVRLGNARTAGAGLCEVSYPREESELGTDDIPYSRYLPTTGQTDGCYMMLLSNLVLRGLDGEMCGFEESALTSLEERLGVEDLSITPCSTSVVSVRGFNRTLGGHIPSCPMYEQGSVFHLHYRGTITPNAMRTIADEGIGLHRNEGCGRVIFLDEQKYEQVKSKDRETTLKSEENVSDPENSKEKGLQVPSSVVELNEYDKNSIEIAAIAWYRTRLHRAMQHYVVDFFRVNQESGKSAADDFFQGASSSQIGSVESILAANRYDVNSAIDILSRFTEHALEKESSVNIQKQKSKSGGFASRVLVWLKDKSLKEILSGGPGSSVLITADSDEVMGIRMADLTSLMEPEGPGRKNDTGDKDPNGVRKYDGTNVMKIDLILQLIRFRNKNA